MMKHVKKLTLVTTAAFLFCLTAAGETLKPLPMPSTIEIKEDAELTPLPQEPEIRPLSDENDTNRSGTKL